MTTTVWSVGLEAAAQLGDTLSSYQAQLLTWFETVFHLDGKAVEQAFDAYDGLRGVKNRVIVRLPRDKDPGDYSVAYIRQLIYRVALQEGLDLGILDREDL
jgi:hypothetical protein